MKINKKYLKSVFAVLAALVIFTGCEDSIEGDVNTNPFSATVIDPNLLFPQVIVAGISAQRTIELNAINIQCQHWTSTIAGVGVFTNPELYIISTNTTNNSWNGWFQNSLRNVAQIISLTEANNPTALSTIGQAQVLRAMTSLSLTQVFGDIPFSEGSDPINFPNPNFDSQEDVLRGIAVLCAEAVTNLETNTAVADDLLYGGDIESWVRFANSLRLKALMLIANVDPASVQAEIATVAALPLILDSSQDAQLNYLNTPGNENPIWETLNNFAGGNNAFWSSSQVLVDLMNSTNDPRRPAYFDLDGAGLFSGQPQGNGNGGPFSQVSLNTIRPEMPDRYATAPETNFYLAEAALLGFIAGDANAFYQAGIQESLDFYDGQPGAIAEADKDAFLASPRGSISGLAEADALRMIHEESYVANFTRGIEAWTDWRRNRVPEFQLPIGAVLTDVIRRYQPPLSELNSNPNAPPVVPLLTPMFFENPGAPSGLQ